jgi:hypothetical protein
MNDTEKANSASTLTHNNHRDARPGPGRLRPEQTGFLERIKSAGGVAFVARDCLEVLKELIEQKGNKP